jgi:glucoside 3-dehydrogenase (cytochrome c) hitch-hiker subunit
MHCLLQGGLAVALLPGTAAAGWRAVAAAATDASPRFLQPAQARLIAIVADAILPRTDTPSATDVGVLAWIDTIAADYFSDVQRTDFAAGIAAIDDHALSIAGARLASLPSGVVSGVLTSLDAACGTKNLSAAEHGYVQLKDLVIHGYFTSEPVQKDILRVPIIPGRFDPSVPVTPSDAK